MRSLTVRLLGVGVVTAIYMWNTTVGVAALAAVFGYVLAQWTWSPNRSFGGMVSNNKA